MGYNGTQLTRKHGGLTASGDIDDPPSHADRDNIR